ncbi:ATP-binding protein [Roseiterribacter gracilis]|uniref:ATP-binding protein n=1 Tax=Roseiterribacter gracilis TaxID=2812848 RepID=UPI003B43CB22
MTAVAVAVVWLGTLAFIEFDRRTTMSVARSTGENLARVFAEQTARSFDGLDRALRSLVNALVQDPDTDLRRVGRAGEMLGDGLIILTHADANGDVRNRLGGGGPIEGLSVRDRSFFEPLAKGEAEMIISPPFRTRSDGRWIIGVARRIERNGKFDGVVIASVDPRYFQKFFETLDVGEHGAVLLAREDGLILSRTRLSDDMLEGRVRSSAIADLQHDQVAGFMDRVSTIDGVHRLVAYRRVDRVPLFVAVSQARGEILQPVVRRALFLLFGASALSIAMLALLARALRANERAAASTAAARRAESRLRLAIETLGDGFFLFDAEGKFELCNERYRGVMGSAADIVRPGMKFDEYLRVMWDANVLDVRGKSFEEWSERRKLRPNEQGRVYEQRMADGKWMLCVDQRGADGSMVGVRTDITALKRREEELESAREALTRRTRELRQAKREADLANAARGVFLANMSHELRTPLNAIIGFADLIPLFAAQNERLVAYAGHIRDSGLHLLSLIDDLLDLSKIDAGKLDLKPELLPPDRLVETCRTMMSELAQRARVQLELTVEADCPPLFADTRAAKQMALNLLSNAIKFTPVGGRVELRLRAHAKGGVELEVVDNGVGMTADELAIARTPFGQGRAAHLVAQRGSGLGLALVERLIEAHGGRLDLESAPGVGTTARLWFPAHANDTSMRVA